MIVKTQKEVEVKDGVPTLAALKSSQSPQEVTAPTPGEQQPAHRPTLKRPDEQPEPAASGKTGSSPASPQDEPQWGGNGKAGDANPQPPQQEQAKPPR